MFKKNPKASNLKKKPTSAIPQRLLSKTEFSRPISLNLEPSIDYPGLSFIDSDDKITDIDYSAEKKVKTSTTPTTVSNDNIECQPRKLQSLRALDSPTKSLQLDFLSDDKLGKENRRSSLCILALKAATHASSPILNKSDSQTNSLHSMISLPGIPPVMGVNDAQQVQVQYLLSWESNPGPLNNFLSKSQLKEFFFTILQL